MVDIMAKKRSEEIRESLQVSEYEKYLYEENVVLRHEIKELKSKIYDLERKIDYLKGVERDFHSFSMGLLDNNRKPCIKQTIREKINIINEQYKDISDLIDQI